MGRQKNQGNEITESQARQQSRHTIKLDEADYLMLDRWKAWIRFRDPGNRLTVTEIVRRGLELATAELSEKYGQLPAPLASTDNGTNEG